MNRFQFTESAKIRYKSPIMLLMSISVAALVLHLFLWFFDFFKKFFDILFDDVSACWSMFDWAFLDFIINELFIIIPWILLYHYLSEYNINNATGIVPLVFALHCVALVRLLPIGLSVSLCVLYFLLALFITADFKVKGFSISGISQKVIVSVISLVEVIAAIIEYVPVASPEIALASLCNLAYFIGSLTAPIGLAVFLILNLPPYKLHFPLPKKLKKAEPRKTEEPADPMSMISKLYGNPEPEPIPEPEPSEPEVSEEKQEIEPAAEENKLVFEELAPERFSSPEFARLMDIPAEESKPEDNENIQ